MILERNLTVVTKIASGVPVGQATLPDSQLPVTKTLLRRSPQRLRGLCCGWEPVAEVGRDFLRSGLSVSGPARLMIEGLNGTKFQLKEQNVE